MTNLGRRLTKITDNLSIKYEFIYLIKTYKKISLLIFILYASFVFYIIEQIYTKDHWRGIIENILPFFVDVAIIFVITVLVLILRTIYNDENARIIETQKNTEIKQKKYMNIPITSIKIDFNKNLFYTQPRIIQNLLKWVNFDKDDYFRTHYGALDISKIAVNEILIDDEQIFLNCSQTSFYDISFTHYFPDYKLSLSSSKDLGLQYSLRELFENNIESYYKEVFRLNKFKLFDLLPNPLGLTGIVNIEFKDTSFYLLQIRHSSEIAARNKIQWSFAGTIDVVPNLYKDDILFQEFVEDELFDEVVYKEKELKILENEKYNASLLGMVINPLYLYQPEFFVLINYKLDETKYNLKRYLIDNEKRTIEHIKSKNKLKTNFIVLTSLSKIKEYILDNNGIQKRNLFESGFEFLLKRNI